MCRHGNFLFRRNRILRPPQASYRLPLRIEIDAALPIKVARSTTCNRLLITSKAEHWQWNRNRYINTLLTSLDLFLEARRGCTGSRENGCTVTIGVGVDKRNSLIDRGNIEADKDGAEDLFPVALHMRLDVCDN